MDNRKILIIGAGRQTGKSYLNHILRQYASKRLLRTFNDRANCFIPPVNKVRLEHILQRNSYYRKIKELPW